jgi:protein gp37
MSSGISYCDETWNPICGCPKPLISPGCEHCWARSLHNMRHKAYLAGKKLPEMYAKPFEEIQFFPERLYQPLHWKKPKVIFAGSQTDLFHDGIPFEWVDEIMAVIRGCPKHKFLFLTKRPKRMAEYSCQKNHIFPDNCWVGATFCNQKEIDRWMESFLSVRVADNLMPKRWLSLEPIQSEIDIGYGIDGIDQVVVGCESGPGARLCKLEWIESIVDQCSAAGVSCYVKQVQINGKCSTNPAEWHKKLRQRSLIWMLKKEKFMLNKFQ